MIEQAAALPEETAISVMVVDDQAIIRDGLTTLLDVLPDVVVWGEAADGAEAVARVADAAPDARPDVILMDLRMPRLDGAAATREIIALHPAAAILVLTTYADDASIGSALQAGARGYLTKDAGRAELAAAIRSVARGQVTFAPEVGARLVASLTAERTVPGRVPDAVALHAGFPDLTRREAEVLAEMARGLSNPEIAAALFVSVPTVKSYVNTLFAKLGVHTRAQAIARALGSDPGHG